jgi:hypothetical protein
VRRYDVMNIIDALEGPFEPWFSGPSWAARKTILKAAFALPMTPRELITFGELAGGRSPPPRRVKELVDISGRRSGKDSIASAIIAFMAAIEQAHLGRLRPGEPAVCMLLAMDREQARIIQSYVRSYFEAIPELKAMVVRETRDGLELSNNVEIVIATNDFRSVRGRSVLVAVLDEVAHYRDERSTTPDIELDRALSPSLATIPESMKILISTAYRRGGLLFEKWRKFYGVDDDRVLVIQASTPQLNPLFDMAEIDRAMEDDPMAARAEYFSQWRDDVSSAFARDVVERAIVAGRVELPPIAGERYRAFVDAAAAAAATA